MENYEIFKFEVHMPLKAINRDETEQFISITMSAPQTMFKIKVEDTNNYELQQRLAKSELKIKMIEALLAGKWIWKTL